MSQVDEMMRQAARVRDLAKEVRAMAMTLSGKILQQRIIRQAEDLENEAANLEAIIKARKH